MPLPKQAVRPPHGSVLRLVAAVVLAAVLWVALGFSPRVKPSQDSVDEAQPTPAAVALAPPSDLVAEYPVVPIGDLPVHRGAEPAATVLTVGVLARGETLGSSLGAQGVSASTVHVLSREMRSVFDFRHAHPGDSYRLEQDEAGDVLDFRYSTSPEESFHLYREAGGFVVRPEAVELLPRVSRIAGVVETSLYTAIRTLGEDPILAESFADLFAWDIDFSRSVQAGDDFQILYERLYRVDADSNESYVRPGRILAARYRGIGVEHSAVFYENQDGEGRYYRGDGSSIELEFLVAPLQFSRISSRFSSARRHPILKVTRPHHGIDYAATVGTPVWAVSEGTVTYRGWAGGFGNLVKVRHANGFVSYYAHLSGFHRDVRVGANVEQKQTIGYVGQTGLATGPHVCFRVAKDGHYVNPLRLKSPAGEPVDDEHWVDFQTVRDTLFADLDATTLVATDEAL